MPRDGVTQTRTFNYLDPVMQQPTAFLQSATNPENGTVSYAYSSNGLLATKTDAKGQQFTYNYDGYLRLTSVSAGGNVLRTYYYDSNPLDGTFSQYALGRLTAIQYASTGPSLQFTDMYSYTPGGLPNKKRLQMNQAMTWMNGYQQYTGTRTLNLDASYGWDSEGRMTSVTYPSTTTLSADYYPVQQPVAGRIIRMDSIRCTGQVR